MVICGACGQPGHRRDNKKCQFYNEYIQNKSKSGDCGQEGHRRKTKSKKNPQWKDSAAQAELRSILNNDNDRKHLFTPAEKLQKLHPSFADYQLSSFKGYVITLKNEAMRMNKNWPKPWDKSEAITRKDSITGRFRWHL